MRMVCLAAGHYVLEAGGEWVGRVDKTGRGWVLTLGAWQAPFPSLGEARRAAVRRLGLDADVGVG